MIDPIRRHHICPEIIKNYVHDSLITTNESDITDKNYENERE